jgi:hypothetical protein
MSGNVMPGHFDESDQMEGTDPGGVNGGVPPYDLFVDQPFFESYATVDSAQLAYKKVLSDVGANQPLLDDHDTRIVQETLDGTTSADGSESGIPGLPDRESDVGGFENYPEETRPSEWDTDLDGLPNFWEELAGTSPTSPADDFSDSNSDPDLNGYTLLDDYLQWMAEPHYFTPVNTQISVDLGDLFRGFEDGPTYSVTSGGATISGSNATFTPTTCGLHSFTVQVEDGDGAMSRVIGVFADGC